jgi:hypothetical protein
MQCACACAVLSSVACQTVPYFSTLSHKWYDFLGGGGDIEHKTRVSILCTTFVRGISLCKKNSVIIYHVNVGRDSSVGIATRYGLVGQGIQCRWRRDFPHLSRPVLGSTQLPIQWVPGHSRRYSGRGVALTTHTYPSLG